MDKYEYRLKAEQIETQVNKRDYEAAAKIADTIDWRRVKNLNMLYMVSEVYEKTERYGECMEILDMAYDRAPVGRMLLYRMTEVCTKMHNFDEAIALYREFVKAAPHDLSRYILKYQIYRERGSSLEDQIKVLSEYKKQDYQEKWGYELACLYEEAGMLEECVRECDQLFLWYSEGEYVQKALELKMKYEPLTLLQKEKYNYQRIGSDSSVYEAGSQKPEVPGVDVGRFSTVNLQAELAENLDQLLKEDATIDLPQLKVVNKNTVSINQEPDSLYCEDGTIDLPELGPDGKVIEPDDREDGTIELPSLGLDKEEEDAPESEPELGYREDGTIELPELGPDGKVVKPDFREDGTIELPTLGLDEEEGEPEAESGPEPDFREDGTIELPELGPDGQAAEPDFREDGTIELPNLGLGEEEEEPVTESEPEPDFREDGTIELPNLGLDGEGEEPEAESEPEPDFREDGTIELPNLGLGEDEEEPVMESEPEPDFREDGTIELPNLGLGEDEEEPVMESEPEPDFREDGTIELPNLGLGEDEEEPVMESEPEPDFREDGTIELPNLGLGEEEEEPVTESEPEPDFREDGTIELPNLGLDGEGEEPEAESEPEPDFREDKTIELPNLDLEGDAPEKDADGPVSIDDILSEWEKQKEQTEAKLEAAAKEEKVRRAKVKQETAELMKLISGISEEIPEDVRQILDEIDKENQAAEEPVVTEDDLPPDVDEEEETEEELDIENLAEKEEPEDLTEREEAGEGRSGNMIQDLERSLSSKVSEGAVSAGHLTREQARLFTYFTSIQGMSEQLSVLFKDVNQREQTSSSRGNLTITGERGNGKTTLAIDIVKALQKQKRIEGKKLAKISGQKMNTKDIYEVLTKLKGGALIIEKAGGLSDATMMAMSLAMETDTGGLLVILEDSSEEIQKLFVRNRNFASKFDHTIDIPIFTNDELVAFGKSYAQEQRYSFDEFGILALYDRIGSRQTNDHLVTVAEVKEMIDDAIQKAEKGSIRHLFEKVTKKSVDEFGYHLIREADFEE